MAKPKKKSKKGLGYLYKRDVHGREHPATSKIPGVFWLDTTGEDGRRTRRRLEVDGKPVTDLETARAEQNRLRVPYITGTELDALRAELGRLEVRQAAEEDDADPPLTLDDAWDAFESAANRPECGADTMRQHRSNWRDLAAWLRAKSPEARYLREITETVAGQYMTDFGRQAISANTYNKRIGFFKMFFRVLGKQARIQTNPFSEISRRRMQQHSRRDLTFQEARAVLLQSSGEMKRLFWLGYFTGLRLGDCCTLRWAEVDLAAEVIRRVPRKTSAHGKHVVVGIPATLLRMLAEVEPKTGYVCPTYAERYIKSRTEQTNISREIQAFFIRCGIETKAEVGNRRRAVVVGFHSLRHTYASIHAESGTPQALIQENMGHSSPGMTEHYEHISEETARRVAAALDLPQIAEDGGTRAELLRIVQTASEDELARLLEIWRGLKANSITDHLV